MIERYIPNLQGRAADEFVSSIFETLQMVLLAGIISFVLGIILGVALVVTFKQGMLANVIVYNILDKVINIFRSIPFLILIVFLIPFSRMIAGTALGVRGVIVPLVIGTTPFFARQVESAVAEVDRGLIEASIAMGLTPFQIIMRVYLRESIPTITRVTMVTLVNLIALSAITGSVAAGGLGDFALRYGFVRGYTDLMWLTIVVILVIVSIIHLIGNTVIKFSKH